MDEREFQVNVINHNNNSPCPHERFKAKHVCREVANEANALKCAERRNRAGYNHVLFGNSEYEIVKNNMCKNTVSMSLFASIIVFEPRSYQPSVKIGESWNTPRFGQDVH